MTDALDLDIPVLDDDLYKDAHERLSSFSMIKVAPSITARPSAKCWRPRPVDYS